MDEGAKKNIGERSQYLSYLAGCSLSSSPTAESGLGLEIVIKKVFYT